MAKYPKSNYWVVICLGQKLKVFLLLAKKGLSADAQSIQEHNHLVVEMPKHIWLLHPLSVYRQSKIFFSYNNIRWEDYLTFEYSTTEKDKSSPPLNFFIDFLIFSQGTPFAMVGSSVTTPL